MNGTLSSLKLIVDTLNNAKLTSETGVYMQRDYVAFDLNNNRGCDCAPVAVHLATSGDAP